ncbi:SpoIID/LytB domain-containing protein [Bacillus shivajii]|uniref:SpoIID/LytB domain-containing protein n=1 Tax=Bacillus shivajii TaxID=1983719 RepID=UPI001CFACAA8|nr:SpoIID/LytB domain-containing protein [Bacillus shivajii]UCZ52983.1 SpoIID/LytB domain-containing protein [Bacillus shivajii]
MSKVLKVFFVFLFVSASFMATSSLVSFADDEEQMIRVGVVPNATSLTVGSETSYQLESKETGVVLYEGESEEVTVELQSQGTIETLFRLQTGWISSESALAEWLTQAEEEGYPTYVEPHNDGYRMLAGAFSLDASWGEREAFRQELIDKGLAGSDAFWRQITTSEGESSISIGDDLTYEGAVVLRADNGLVTVNGQPYRGFAEVEFNSAGTLVAINELPLEEYLYGVVPHELPPVPYGELEAQKTQAVAARTYALSNLGKRSSDGYDLLPTTSDQVYGGYGAEHPISNSAVDETRGVVATYDGELITAVYHSTSGGFTANNEDVWNTEAVPYLRGAPDANRGNAFDNVPTLEVFKNSGNAKSLRGMNEGAYESDWSRYHRWTFEWTMEEMTESLSARFNTDVGKVYEINVLERSDSGRVYEIEFVTENGTFSESKDQIRWALQYFNAQGNLSPLLSTLFFIEPIMGKQEVVGFEVYGGGWGHGVGMSQTGAVGMAEKGADYEEILKHYYQGIDLDTIY